MLILASASAVVALRAAQWFCRHSLEAERSQLDLLAKIVEGLLIPIPHLGMVVMVVKLVVVKPVPVPVM